MRKPTLALILTLSLLGLAAPANAAGPGRAAAPGVAVPGVAASGVAASGVVVPGVAASSARVWPLDRLGKVYLQAYFASERESPLLPRALAPRPLVLDEPGSRAVVQQVLYPPVFDLGLPGRGPVVPPRLGFVFHKLDVREQMDGLSPLDRHSAADRYSPSGAVGENVFVIEMGQDASVVAYGRRYGERGGAGSLRLGKLVEAAGTALFRRDGQISITHNLDLRLMQIALNAPGVSVSPFARAGFLLDFYPDGARRGTIIPGAGLDFNVSFGFTYPLRLEVMASPELTIDSAHATSELGARLLVGAEILMF